MCGGVVTSVRVCVCWSLWKIKIMKTGYLWAHTPLQDEHIVCESCQYAASQCESSRVHNTLCVRCAHRKVKKIIVMTGQACTTRNIEQVERNFRRYSFIKK